MLRTLNLLEMPNAVNLFTMVLSVAMYLGKIYVSRKDMSRIDQMSLGKICLG